MAELAEFKCLDRAAIVAEAITTAAQPIKDTVQKVMCGRIPRKTLEERIEEMSPDERHAAEIIAQMSKEYEGLFVGFSAPSRSKPKEEIRQLKLPESGKEIEKAIKETKEQHKAQQACFKEANRIGNCIKALTQDTRDTYRVNMATGLCMCGDVLIRKEKPVEQGIQKELIR